MTSTEPIVSGRLARSSTFLTGWGRHFAPSLSDCFFGALLVWLFANGPGGWLGLLADGDLGWHIRTGEYVLAAGRVPTVDLYSFSKAGQPWYAWEWLADVLYALLFGAGGFRFIVFLTAVLLAGYATALVRHALWRGANAFAAMVAVLLTVGASSIHYLARPHVFTLVLLTVSMWLIDADRRSPSRRIWLLVPMTALWTNLHGGFPALLACLGLASVGMAVEALLDRRTLRPALRYAALTAGCTLATLANPYGMELHRHIFAYLRSDWIRNVIQEFQSPVFRSESMFHLEALLVLGVLTAGAHLSRRQVVEPLWILFWAHQSLGSVRHAPLFAVVAAPLIAVELTRWWDWALAGAPRRSFRAIFDSLARDLPVQFRRTSVWAAVLLLAVLLPAPVVRWPLDFPAVKFPSAMIGRHAARLVQARLFTSDQWADYLIFRFYPNQRVFVDGRSDFYGPEIGNPYIRLSQGQYDWEQILDKNNFDLVLSPVDWPLASLLKRHPGWRLVEDDGQALLFERVKRATAGRHLRTLVLRVDSRQKITGVGLMERSLAAESTNGAETA